MAEGGARRLARTAFVELAFQATYGLRQGNPLPPTGGRGLPAKAGRRVLQSKVLIAALLAFLTLGTAFLIGLAPNPVYRPAGLSVPMYRVGLVSGLLGVDVGLLWWTGLQALPSLLGAPILEVLRPLPIPPATFRRTAAIVYLRLFDVPAGVVAVGTPLAVGLALGPIAGVAVVPASLCAVVFALALALETARFFVRRIQGARGGGGSAILRWAYLLLWLLPAFGLLAFATAGPPFLRALSALGATHGIGPPDLIAAVFPVPLALWPILSGGVGAVPPPVAGVALGAGSAYVGLAAVAGAWLVRSVGATAVLPARRSPERGAAPLAVRSQRAAWAIVTKDVRIASRTPGFAFLLLLPLLDAVALGLVTYAGAPGTGATRAVAFGAVSVAALLATFFGPAFFALEVIAQSYARTLPIAARSLVLGKVSLIALVYVAAGALVLGITALRLSAPAVFAAFVAAELPAVVAAGLLEMGLLLRWARTRGLPVTSLYASTWNVVLVALPGLLLAVAPLAAYGAAGLAAMAAVALAELAAVAPLVLRREGR